MKRRLLSRLTILFCLFTSYIWTNLAFARDSVRIVGSPVVLEFAEQVAKRYAQNWAFPPPTIVPTGTGVGFGLFCAGVGFQHPDINVASRRMTAAELQTCKQNGVTSVTEVEFGLDAIVLVSSKEHEIMNLRPIDLHRALARQVVAGSAIIRNNTQSWSDINPGLPSIPIEVMGPAEDSPIMYGFLENVMASSCVALPQMAALNEDKRYRICRSLRTDNAFHAGLKNEARIIDWVRENPNALAVVDFMMYQRNQDALLAHRIDGKSPTIETMHMREYPLTTSLYIYVKNQHVDGISGLQNLLYEFTSERAISPDGYLSDRGFVAVDDIARNRARDNAISLRPLTVETLEE